MEVANPRTDERDISDDDLLEGDPEKELQMQGPKAMETDKNRNQTAGGQPHNSHKAPSRSKTLWN